VVSNISDESVGGVAIKLCLKRFFLIRNYFFDNIISFVFVNYDIVLCSQLPYHLAQTNKEFMFSKTKQQCRFFLVKKGKKKIPTLLTYLFSFNYHKHTYYVVGLIKQLLKLITLHTQRDLVHNVLMRDTDGSVTMRETLFKAILKAY